MKNKGRKQLALGGSTGSGGMNCKGCLTHITRPITSMSSKGQAGGFEGKKKVGRFDKRKWSKRVRGYFKTQASFKIIND